MIFRIRYVARGGHVHCRFFSGSRDGVLGKCGDLVMRLDEFDLFREAATFIQFREEHHDREAFLQARTARLGNE